MSVLVQSWPEARLASNASGCKLSVVIPAYNEESGIAKIVERVLNIRASLQAAGVADLEVVVVDDGSRDQTATIVSRFPDVRLIRHKTNQGYGAALKTGFHSASGDLLAFLDADGTYPPEHFPSLCKAALDGADLVIGSRMGGAKSEMPVLRRLGNLFFASMVSLIGDYHVSDSASGMRVFRREVLQRLYPLPNGLNFTPAMSTRAIHESMKMVEVPIPYSERVGRSKLSVVKDGLRFLNCIVWTALSYNPVRILGMLGMAGMIFAVLVVISLAVLRLSGVTQLDRLGIFAVYAALLMGVVGVSLYSLGAMFNRLVSLFQRGPIKQGLFGKPLFERPLYSRFWWIGALSIVVGVAVGIGSLLLSFNGWDVTRLWLWLLGSAMLVLVGVQLIISWIVMRVLEELSQRDALTSLDLKGHG